VEAVEIRLNALNEKQGPAVGGPCFTLLG